jgi:hypothetical protein
MIIRRSLALLGSAGCAAALLAVPSATAAPAPAPSEQASKAGYVETCVQPWGATTDYTRKIEMCLSVQGSPGQWSAGLGLEVGSRATTATSCTAQVRLQLSRSSDFSNSWYTSWAGDNGWCNEALRDRGYNWFIAGTAPTGTVASWGRSTGCVTLKWNTGATSQRCGTSQPVRLTG